MSGGGKRLRDRAGQVFDLLKEMVRLHVRVQEVEAQLSSAPPRELTERSSLSV
jgi:hypothetical protein